MNRIRPFQRKFTYTFDYPDTSSEETDDDEAIRGHFQNFFEKSKKKDDSLSLMERVSYNFT